MVFVQEMRTCQRGGRKTDQSLNLKSTLQSDWQDSSYFTTMFEAVTLQLNKQPLFPLPVKATAALHA